MFMQSAYDAFGIDVPATHTEWVSILFVRAADALARMIEAGKPVPLRGAVAKALRTELEVKTTRLHLCRDANSPGYISQP